jgi:hypothetical protein
MHRTPPGIAQSKTDTVTRAMEILKDRAMPQPRPGTPDQNPSRGPAKAANSHPSAKR